MRRVTLCVDALDSQLGGIGRYTWELCKGLSGRSDIDELKFYGRQQLLPDPSVLLRGESAPPRPGRLSSWWQARDMRAGLIHGPNYFLPQFAERGVITVHDLSVFRFPETHPAARIRAFEREFERSLARASHVITDTETVRGEIIADHSVHPDRITAVPLGVGVEYRPFTRTELRRPLLELGLKPREYGLCVSTLEPRKKITQLLGTWERLPPQLRDSFPLVLAGGSGWRNEALREKIAAGVAQGWLRHLGFVDETTLPALYAGAALFVYPSIYEGFGLPPLEAMASGVPILISQYSCLPEVCGAAARYIDPDNEGDFREKLIHALSDREWQAQSVERGLARSAQFSWPRCVDGTVAVYQTVDGGPDKR